MNTREQNEKKFGHWDELPGGGRPGIDSALLAGDLRRPGEAGRSAREIPGG